MCCDRSLNVFADGPVHTSQPAADAAIPVRLAAHEPPVRNLLTNASSINEDVIIRLKWGQTEYKGRLISVDSYMNIQLSDTEEYIDRKHTGTLGQVLIR